MRGNPLLRAALLAVSLGLTSVLIAAVLDNARPPVPAEETAVPAPPLEPGRVAALLSFTLSAPAKSITLTERSGRILAVPVTDALWLEHETELTVTGHHWEARLTVEWQDPSRHNFLRLDFEPDHLKSSSLTLDFRPHSTEQAVNTIFDPN